MASVAVETGTDKNSILAQLERLFVSAAFRNSRRSQALLRHIVEHYLEHGGAHLKERSLGIEVFGRDTDYDTGTDPVVRVVAGDIRKRLAQYYQEPGHEHEIRIELPAGCYAPEFHLPALVPPVPGAVHAITTEPVPEATPPAPPRFRRWRLVKLVLASLVAVGIGAWAWQSLVVAPIATAAPAKTLTALDRFWSPIIAGAGPVQIELGTWPGGNVVDVGWPDVMASSQVMAFLQQYHKGYELQNANVSKLNALTQGPTVFIGGFNNPWTIALTQPLRFYLVKKGKVHWIVDRNDPGKEYLMASGTIAGSVRQYALIARLSSPVTGQESVVVAGVGVPATMFASKFVTSAGDMDALARQLPEGWESRNIEAVISGQAVGGAPGAPHIVAVDAW